MVKVTSLVLTAYAISSNVNGFTTISSNSIAFKTVSSPVSSSSSSSSSSSLSMAKGFGAAPEPKREKSQGQIKRESESSKYDEIASTGGQQYNIFVRQFGSDDSSWLPTGSIAVPRGEQVADAIFANEDGLKSAIVRTYPKLKGFENEFEFGFNLKVYPDDPVEVAMKSSGKKEGMSVGNWISNLLSPVDASDVGKN